MHRSPSTQVYLYKALVIITVIGLVVFLGKITFATYSGSSLDHVAGAWIGLALDFSDGMFYRPLYNDEIGYGGTRFFPLFFSLHSLLIGTLGMPIVSGHIVSLLAGLLLFTGCYRILRLCHVKPIQAIALITLLISCASLQLGLTTIRGDILPLALNISGLALLLSPRLNSPKLLLVSAIFVLAFSTKITSIHGILTAFIWLVLNGRKPEAVRLLFFTITGCLFFLFFLYLGTSGRILSIFSISSSGGASIYGLLRAPIGFVNNITSKDPISLLCFFWAITAFINNLSVTRKHLTVIFFLVSCAITVFIHGTPGINYNHLVDISASSLLVVGSLVLSSKQNSFRTSSYTLLILLSFSILFSLPSLKALSKNNKNEHFPAEIVSLFKDDNSLVLSEEVMLPILADKNPYLLDPFMLRLAINKNDTVKTSIFDKVKNKAFSAIVFKHDPLEKPGWYAASHFGTELLDLIFLNYSEQSKIGRYTIYLPNH